MDKLAEKSFKERLGEMNESKLHAYVLSLVKNICLAVDKENLNSTENTNSRKIFARENPADIAILSDPVVVAFNSQIKFLGHMLPSFFQKCASDLASKTIGWAYENRAHVGRGGTRIADLLKDQPLENLSKFVDAVCKSRLDKIISNTDRDFNFIGSDISEPMYAIDIEFNAITTYEEQYGCYFTADDLTRDGLITHDFSLVLDGAHQAIEFELDKLEKIAYDETTSFKDTLLITAIKVRRNDTPILRVPFKIDGFDSTQNPNIYDIGFRRNLNSSPREGYVLDFENIEALEANSVELRTLSKLVPRHAALKLRGKSVEQDLGM